MAGGLGSLADVRRTASGRVAGKVALVTGGGRGIGAAIAALFSAEGACVYVTDIDEASGEAAVADGNAVQSFRHDVASATDWRSVIEAVEAREGRLDILVNNAGIALGEGANDVDGLSERAWQQVLAVNGYGTLLGCRHAAAIMSAGGGGAIVNLSSIAAFIPTPTIAAYGFSKAGVSQLTRSVASLGLAHGVRCNAVHPGIIPTAMTEGLLAYNAGLRSDHGAAGAQSLRDAQVAMQTPADIALAVLYLASDEARFVTGAELVVDGGQTIGVR